MQSYHITLANEKRRTYTVSLVVLTALSGVAFIFLAWTAAGIPARNISLTATGVIGICLLVYRLVRKEGRILLIYAAMILSTVFFILMGHYIPGGILLLVLLLFIQAVRKPVVIVSDTSVTCPGFPGRTISWNELNNILIRDGLLTIDWKNNKLFQQPVDETESPVNEKEFNEFCRIQLNSTIR